MARIQICRRACHRCGRRVVHGGRRYAVPTVVTPEVLADLRALEPLAPLHQPYNLAAIEAVFKRLPDVPRSLVLILVFTGRQSPRRALVRASKARVRMSRSYSVMAFMASRTNTSLQSCTTWRPRLLKNE